MSSSSDSDTDLVHVRVSTLDDPDDDHDMIVISHHDETDEDEDDINQGWMEPVHIVQHEALQHIQQQQQQQRRQTTPIQTQTPTSGTNIATAPTTVINTPTPTATSAATATKTPTPTTATATATATSPAPAAVATSSSSPQQQHSPSPSPSPSSHSSPPLSHIIIPTYIHPSSPVPPSPSLASTIPLSTPSHAATDDIMRPSPSNPVLQLQQGTEKRPLPSDHPSPTHATSTPTSSPTSTPRIICGPIIGRVTHDTVRILMEVSHACILTMTVVMEGNTVVTVTAPPSPSIHESHPVTSSLLPISHSHTQSLSANTPTIYVIPHLHPHTRYHVTCTCDIELSNITSSRASFQTASHEQTSLRVAMAADDHFSSTSSSSTSSTSSLWHHLSSRLGDIDLLLLHLPINTHTLYQQCIAIYQQHTDVSTASNTCRTYLSQHYRTTWTSLSHILSHIQTLCIPHRPFTSTSASSHVHHHIIRDIQHVQNLYERQLWDDIDDRKEENAATPIDDASSYHVWNQIGVILLSPHTSSLSRFTHELTSGMMSHVSHLILGLDQPLVVRGQRRVCVCDGICRRRKHQTPPLASSSLQSSILDTLTTWLRQASSRYITILTAHGEQSAAQTDIQIDDATSPLVIPHITSGPMSSSPPSALSHTLTLALRACAGDRISPHHILSSTSYTRSRCFALIHAMTSHDSSPSLRTLMITDETSVKQKVSSDVELESPVEKDRRVSSGTGDEKTLV